MLSSHLKLLLRLNQVNDQYCTLTQMYIIVLQLSTLHTGVDFINTSFTITVPASETERGLYIIPLPDVFVIDDDINENCQSFALVAQIGSDVPDKFTCFQRSGCRECCGGQCFGRNGAIEIKIVDNDGNVICQSFTGLLMAITFL